MPHDLSRKLKCLSNNVIDMDLELPENLTGYCAYKTEQEKGKSSQTSKLYFMAHVRLLGKTLVEVCMFSPVCVCMCI